MTSEVALGIYTAARYYISRGLAESAFVSDIMLVLADGKASSAAYRRHLLAGTVSSTYSVTVSHVRDIWTACM